MLEDVSTQSAPAGRAMTNIKIDRIDLKILETLQRDGRITNQKLAEKVCLSPSSCLQRVRRLEKEKVIRSCHARIDLSHIARHIMCIAMVSLKNHTQEEFRAFENLVETIPEVVEYYTVSGEPDFIMRIICADMNRYLAINDQLVGSSSYQVNISSYVVMKENKAFEAVDLSTLKDRRGAESN